MVATLDIIDSVHPADNATGIPLSNTIQITFDREIDEWSIEHGGLIIEGPDSDQVIYPDYIPTVITPGTEGEILQSPGLMGIVPGQFTFQRIALNSTDIISVSDTTGAGNLYRTKVLFKPDYPLQKQTKYRVYLVGDDSDDNITGLRSRSVFDPVAASNQGNGTVTFSGTYLGDLTQDTLNIRITKEGIVGEAEFEVWRTSQPLDLVGPIRTSTGELQLLDGVTVNFMPGTFEVDDEFSVKVKRPTFYTGIANFSFSTGNGSISIVPLSTATSVTGDPVLPNNPTFSILKTTPSDGASNLAPSSYKRLVVEFNNPIDPSSVNTDTVQITVEPVIDHPLLTSQVQAGPVSHTLTVSGTKLFIDL